MLEKRRWGFVKAGKTAITGHGLVPLLKGVKCDWIFNLELKCGLVFVTGCEKHIFISLDA